MDRIDFRSDTVTWPTPAMREAMAHAELGDDVYGEDPTVNQLEAIAAAKVGMEAGLFVASGTMGNLTSILTHCQRGDEMIVGKQSHIFTYEVASAATYGGVQPNTLAVQRDGTLDLNEVRAAIRGENVHFPTTRLICLENTQGSVGGIPVSKEYISQVSAIAREHDMKLHIDGARIFNAATALGTTVKDLTADADSVQFCFSKGLCAPVGSMIVGSRAFIERGRRIRKSLGGGMRQAGILAAGALYALEHHVTDLANDHAHARRLADALATMDGVGIEPQTVETNIVYFDLDERVGTAEEICRRLHDRGVWMLPLGPQRIRAVTHRHITDESVAAAIEIVQAVVAR